MTQTSELNLKKNQNILELDLNEIFLTTHSSVLFGNTVRDPDVKQRVTLFYVVSLVRRSR